MGVLKIRNAGNTDWIEVGGVGGTQIQDADGDTKIQVEESADEDMIRFDLGGQEIMVLDSIPPQLRITDAIPVGSLQMAADTGAAEWRIEDASGVRSVFGQYGRTNVTSTVGYIYDYKTTLHMINWTEDGHVTHPNQPWVECGGITAAQDNLAINTSHTIKYDQLNENGGDNWDNATWTFTAPVAGKYFAHANVALTTWAGDASIYYMMVTSSNRTIQALHGPTLLSDAANYPATTVTGVMDLDENDTIHFVIYQAGGTAKTDILDLAANTFCSIALIG